MTLLDERILLWVPDSMRKEPRAVNNMSTAISSEREARLVMDVAGRLVLFARDLQELGTEDLLNDWRRVIDPADMGAYMLERLPRHPHLDLIMYTAKERDAGAGAIFLRGLLVRSADDGLMRIDAYVDPTAYRQVGAYDSLLVRMFSKAGTGPGRLLREPHMDTLRTVNGGQVSIHLPRDHVRSTEQGADFVVHRVDRLVPLLSTSRPQLILYWGADPAPIAKELGLGPGGKAERPGAFLGEVVQWDHYRDPDGGLQLMEYTGGPRKEMADGVHVALIGTTDRDMEDLLRIAASIEPVSP